MNEIWLPVTGFQGVYEVSNMGSVRSVDRDVIYSKGGIRRWPGKVLSQTIGSHGYPTVTLCRAPIERVFTVHSLVAAAFLGPPLLGYEAAHKDGIRTNPRLDNLRYATRKENHADKDIHGTSTPGEKHYAAILTEPEVLEIRMMSRAGDRDVDIAKKFGMSRTGVSNIIHNRNWKHVKEKF